MSTIALRNNAMQILVKNLGALDTERFIASVIEEPFDYTEWQKGMYKDMSVRELANYANANAAEG
jgi:hypothetical protein